MVLRQTYIVRTIYRTYYSLFTPSLYGRDDLTTVSPVYSEDSPADQKAALFPSLLVYYMTDPVASGVRGLISELKSDQQNLHL